MANFSPYMESGVLTNDPQILADLLKNQFLASFKAVKLGHTIDPDNQIGCMIAYMLVYPKTCNPADVLMADSQELCLEVLCRNHYSKKVLNAYEKQGVKLNLNEEDRKVLQEGTIDYLAISYY